MLAGLMAYAWKLDILAQVDICVTTGSRLNHKMRRFGEFVVYVTFDFWKITIKLGISLELFNAGPYPLRKWNYFVLCN